MSKIRHWLIAYDRSQRKLLQCTEYEDSGDALKARFELERSSGGADLEVVVLGATSLDTLKRTHGRYFGFIRVPLPRDIEGTP